MSSSAIHRGSCDRLNCRSTASAETSPEGHSTACRKKPARTNARQENVPAAPADPRRRQAQRRPARAARFAARWAARRRRRDPRARSRSILHAPAYGELAQKLGAHVRFSKLVPHRLDGIRHPGDGEPVALQYEWHMHAIHAAKAGISDKIINDLRARPRAASGSRRTSARSTISSRSLHKTKRVSDRTTSACTTIVGDAGMVEFVGICGYYVLVAMTLNVFRMPVPAGAPVPFKGEVTRSSSRRPGGIDARRGRRDPWGPSAPAPWRRARWSRSAQP